jgi:hypothetical protein
VENLFFSGVFFFAVFAAIDFFFFICQNKDLIQTLLNRRNAPRILTGNDIYNLFRKVQGSFLDDFTVFYNVNGYVVVNKPEYIQIQVINGAGDLDNILSAHFIGTGIFYDGDGAIQLSELKIMIDGHSISRFDMIQDKTFAQCPDAQRIIIFFLFIHYDTSRLRRVMIRAIRT